MGGESFEQPEEHLYAGYSEADRQEQARLDAVHALGLLERPLAEGIDQVVALAAEVCQTAYATINILDEEWLHSIASVGAPLGRFPREDIPCDLVVRSGRELVAENAAVVPILAQSPVVDGTIGQIGFYASVPMRTVTGHVVGTLCAYDSSPHEFTPVQLRMLRILADQAVGIFQMGDALERARHATEQLARQSRRAQEIVETSIDPFYSCTREGRITAWNEAAERAFGWTRADAVGALVTDLIVPERLRAAIAQTVNEDTSGVLRLERALIMCKDGSEKPTDVSMWSSRTEPVRHIFARDVSEAEAAEKARRAAEALLTAAFEHSAEGIAVVGVAGDGAEGLGRILRANPAVTLLTGRSELVGANLADVLSGPLLEDDESDHRPDLPSGQEFSGDVLPEDDDAIDRQALMDDIGLLVTEPAGTFRGDALEHLTRMPVGTGHIFIHLTVTLTRDAQGRPEHALVQMRDVTAQQTHEQWLIRQTQTDQLTGLANRLVMRERLAEEVAWLRNGHGGLGVLMIDLDNFKAVNDTLGHPAGDDLLCRIAAALTAVLPKEAVAARLGGDEFVVLAPGTTEEAVQSLAQRVGEALNAAGSGYSEMIGVPVGASIGLMFTQNPATDPEELLKAADTAMYENKRVRRYTVPGMRPAGPPADEPRPPLYAVPTPRGAEPVPLPPPTPAPRHNPARPGDPQHPAHTRRL